MPGRCGPALPPETEMVGGRFRGRAYRDGDPLDGPQRAEAVRSEGTDYRIQNGGGRVEAVARAHESSGVLRRDVERFARAGWRLGGGVNGCTRSLLRRNGGEPFRGQTGLGRQAQLLQRLGGEGAAAQG